MSIEIVFLTNYYNHHQSFLAEALSKKTNGSYYFIETTPIEEERIKLGWSNENKPNYVLQAYDEGIDFNYIEHIVYEAKYVITSIPWSKLLKRRLKANKVTFHYSERLYKTGYSLPLLIGRGIKYYWSASRHKSMYLLCSSAYAAQDYVKTGLYKNRAYRWGYFPEVKEYCVDKLIQKKLKQRTLILWAGRLIPWKHAEVAIDVAQELKKKGYSFELKIIGEGEQSGALKDRIAKCGLESCVFMLGSMPPTEVRNYMEQASIYLFTSDQNEGWGAVLNESMNSACAVVASNSIGSVPYLVENGKNGYIYKSTAELIKYVEILLKDRDLRERIGQEAYRTMISMWNPDIAADRFIMFAEEITTHRFSNLFRDGGPCTKEYT